MNKDAKIENLQGRLDRLVLAHKEALAEIERLHKELSMARVRLAHLRKARGGKPDASIQKEILWTVPDLRRAMVGRKVYIDDYPHSHKHALARLQDGEFNGLVVAWTDEFTLKLEPVWDEWEVG